jgi:peptidoglycan/xylan/chitin deacetylase (PgdA/CDA1 family)
MTFLSQVALARRTILSSLHCRLVPIDDRGPIVSFSFDDFPRNAYTTGGQILKRFCARGTYYAAVGLMGTRNELGEQFCRNDLLALIEDGHELASHTFSHVSCRSISGDAFRREVEEGQRAIEELTGITAPNFAFPFGEVTLSAKIAMSRKTASCRGIWPGLNGPDIDLNLLRANSLYGDNSQCDRVRELIIENEQRKGWLIFYSHDVCPNPSQFGCTPALLEYAVSLSSEGGARILTVGDVVSELTSGTVSTRYSLSERHVDSMTCGRFISSSHSAPSQNAITLI